MFYRLPLETVYVNQVRFFSSVTRTDCDQKFLYFLLVLPQNRGIVNVVEEVCIGCASRRWQTRKNTSTDGAELQTG